MTDKSDTTYKLGDKVLTLQDVYMLGVTIESCRLMEADASEFYKVMTATDFIPDSYTNAQQLAWAKELQHMLGFVLANPTHPVSVALSTGKCHANEQWHEDNRKWWQHLLRALKFIFFPFSK